MSIADWDWEGEDADPGHYQIPEFRPWRRGQSGKGLISPDGKLITWQINTLGDPHHDVVSADRNFPYAAKVNIAPNGSASIPSPDDLHLVGMTREEAEGHLKREAPAAGLTPDLGFTSSTRTCPTCHDPLKGEYQTFCPRCQWSERNVNLDHDPLSNPPDPTVDMHRGIQARTIPSHRWARWFTAVEDL